MAISEITSKYEISDYKQDTYCGVPLQQMWMLQHVDVSDFSKKLHHSVFLFFGEFFQNRHKEQLLVNSSKNIK